MLLRMGDSTPGSHHGLAKNQVKFPSSVRSELSFGNGQIISAAIRAQPGYSVWTEKFTRSPTRKPRRPATGVARLRSLANFKKNNVLARTLSSKAVENGAAYVVEFSLRSGARLRYLFSPTTKLLMGIEDDARKTITFYDDYRSTGNILEPHRMTVDLRGSGVLTFTEASELQHRHFAEATFESTRPQRLWML